jgi:hypothetical protein
LFDTAEGYRHQVIATGTPLGDGLLIRIEARHWAHARIEDQIQCGKDSGFGRFPSRECAINQAWRALALTGVDLVCWMRMLLEGGAALAELKKPRHRLLRVAVRTTRSARRTRHRTLKQLPWVRELVAAFEPLAALPRHLTC